MAEASIISIVSVVASSVVALAGIIVPQVILHENGMLSRYDCNRIGGGTNDLSYIRKSLTSADELLTTAHHQLI